MANPDPRWPAVIYPIHYVEKILKPLGWVPRERTRGWSGNYGEREELDAAPGLP